ncbi:replicative DNA helicase [Acetobacter sicerae]|uniref:replicative DNA helicase n=1 Tax=Acetobacter sicerae TaxID=85325 RepID=UPI00156A8AF7|nr:replicative DNA helicase [Acetobacter sicerae]NHN93778.1 AAA family ATPase [Acetobacter sicerae]
MSPFDNLTGDGLRPVPANIDAEQRLLAAILTNNKAFDLVSDILQPDYFANVAHRLIYGCLAETIMSGSEAAPWTIRDRLSGSPQFEEVGGVAYVGKLLTATVGWINARDYAVVIRDAWARRTLISLTSEAMAASYAPDNETAADIMGRLETGLMEVSVGSARKTLWSLQDAASNALGSLDRAMKRGSGVVGASTGYKCMDRALGGFAPGSFNVLAGRPAMGKTGLAVGMAIRSAIASGKKTLYWSGEMSAESLSTRLLSAWSGVPASAIRAGGYEKPSMSGAGMDWVHLSQTEVDRIVGAQKHIGDHIYVEEQAGMTVAALQSDIRRISRTVGEIGLVVIDYLDLMRPSKNTKSQFDATTDISQGLLYTAKTLNVPMLILQQLSRQVEAREDKRPIMADLRNSGQIEQDADSIMFVYRDHYYRSQIVLEKKENETEGAFMDRKLRQADQLHEIEKEAEVIIRKNRNGATQTVNMRFDGPRTWFSDPSEREGMRPW